MPSILHSHNFIFNDDGFEVCDKCGVCTSLRNVEQATGNQSFVLQHTSEFFDILVNNHIGYGNEVEDKYRMIKRKLVRGYPNRALYAYCTYQVLLENDIYYSIQHISTIFQIRNLKRSFCQIESKLKGRNQYFDISHNRYIFSSISIFLAQINQSVHLKDSMNVVERMRKQSVQFKPHFLICLSLYHTLKDVYDSTLLQKLSCYYSINLRTLKAFTKHFI